MIRRPLAPGRLAPAIAALTILAACASEKPARKPARRTTRPAPVVRPIQNAAFPVAEVEPSTARELHDTFAALRAPDNRLCWGYGSTALSSQARVDTRLAVAAQLAPWAAAVTRTLAEARERHPELLILEAGLDAALTDSAAPQAGATNALLWMMTEAAIATTCGERTLAPLVLPVVLTRWATSAEAILASLFQDVGPHAWVKTRVTEDYWLSQQPVIRALQARLERDIKSLGAPSPSQHPHVTQSDRGATVVTRSPDGSVACASTANVEMDESASGFGSHNGLVDPGEMIRFGLDCRNASGTRLMSESLILDQLPGCMLHTGSSERTLPESAPGASMPLTLGPFVVTDRCSDQEVITYRLISTHRREATITLTVEPRSVDPQVSVAALDRDAAGSSTRGSGTSLETGARAEVTLALAAHATLPTIAAQVSVVRHEDGPPALALEVELPLEFRSAQGDLLAHDDVDVVATGTPQPTLGAVASGLSSQRGWAWMEVELAMNTPPRVVLDQPRHRDVAQSFAVWQRSNADLQMEQYLSALVSLQRAAAEAEAKVLDVRTLATAVSPTYDDLRAAVILLVDRDILGGADLAKALDFLDTLRWADQAHPVSLGKARQLFVWSALAKTLGAEEVAGAIRRRGVFGLRPEVAVGELREVILESRIARELARRDLVVTEEIITATRTLIERERASRLDAVVQANREEDARVMAERAAALAADPWQLPRRGRLYTYLRYVPLRVGPEPAAGRPSGPGDSLSDAGGAPEARGQR